MNRIEKKQFVEQLRSNLSESSLVIAFQAQGLTASQNTDLRFKMSDKSANIKIVKNTLARIAVKGSTYEKLTEFFFGPTTIAYSKDPVAAAKVLVEFAKDKKNINILGGYLDGKILNKEQIEALSKLPSMDELREKIVAVVATPLRNLVSILNAPGSSLVRVVNAYHQK